MDNEARNTISFRVSLTRTVSSEDIRFNGSEHNTEEDANEFAKFFSGSNDITSVVSPIGYNSGYGIAPARYHYRDYTIIDHMDGKMVIRSPGFYTGAEAVWSKTMNGNLHEVLNYIDREIFNNNKVI